MKKIYRKIFFSLIISTILTLAFYFGFKVNDEAYHEKMLTYSALDFIIPLTIILISTFIIYFILDLNIKLKEDKKNSLKRWHIFLPLELLSVVLLLYLFPGYFPADAITMYESFLSNEYTTHFSPFITFLLGIFISFGKLVDNANTGHALFILFQFTIVNIALTETIFYCSTRLKKKSFAIISTVFFFIHPLVQMLQIRSGQDTIFGGFFLLICLEFLKNAEGNYEFKKKNFFYLFVFIFLLCITRNNGIYTIIPVILFSFITLKEKTIRKKILAALTLPIFVFFGYKFILINNIVTEKDSFFLETINVPVMQIARATSRNDKYVDELEKYFNYDCKMWRREKFSWKEYDAASGISDPYKNCMKTEEIEKDPLAFFSLWAKIGIENPVQYFEAPLFLTLGLYYPFIPYNSTVTQPNPQWHAYIDSYISVYYESGVNTSCTNLEFGEFMNDEFYHQKWSKVPVLNQLWRAPFTFFLCIITIILCLYRKKYNYLLPLTFILGLIITVALSPVILFRYLLPAVLCTPIMIYILFKIHLVK